MLLLLLLLLLLPMLLFKAMLRQKENVKTCRYGLLLAMGNNREKVITEQIWREFSDRLRQFIRSRISSAADVDDILQSVFLKIHQNFNDLRSVERMESWVFQVTRNTLIDYFRKKQTMPDDIGVQHVVAETTGDTHIVRDIARCVARLIDHLPEDQRRAVAMYELERIPQAEIAKKMSISVSGAKSRIQRGRRNLEAMLRECCRFQIDARGNVMDYEVLTSKCKPGYGCNDEPL